MERTASIRILRLVGASFVLGLVSGCASLDPEPDWKEVQALVESGVGATPAWDRSEADVAAARARTEALLSDGLSRNDAVEIALANDPSLQARFDGLGLARADYVQAGLFTNPQLGGYVGFPLDLDGSAMTLLIFLSDLWIVPAREAVAETQLAQAVQEAAAAGIDTALSAEEAYDAVLYRERLVELERRNLALRRKAMEREARKATPKSTRESIVRENASAASLADQEIAEAEASRNLFRARNALQRLLQLPDGIAGVKLADVLDEPGEGPWGEERATSFALERRIDLAAARLHVEETRRRIALVRRSMLGEVGLGPGYNGGFGNDDNWGPAVSLTLPIFDQGQAQLASATFEERKAVHELAALEASTRREVADALADRNFHQQSSDVLEQTVRPARERLSQAAEPGGERDLAEFLHWIKAQEDAIDAERSYVTSIYNLRTAHTTLERTLFLGGGGGDGGSDSDGGGGDDGDGD